MTTTFHRVREMHKAFGHPAPEVVVPLTPERAKLRLLLIAEEFQELIAATVAENVGDGLGSHPHDLMGDVINSIKELQSADFDQNMVEQADALGDLDVVVNGAAVEMGLPMDQISVEIFESNMSKLGVDGKPIYREDGKFLKGPNYRAPNLEQFLK